MCQRGDSNCPGNVPLDAEVQCKSHRCLARVKAKIAAASGEGAKNSWISAVTANNKITTNFRQANCWKECCRLIHPQQVLNYIPLEACY